MRDERRRLAEIFEKYRKTGVGAEIGCLRGEFTKYISTIYQGRIFGIDAFVGEAGIPEDPLTEQKCIENFKGTKCELVKGFSVDVAKKMPNGTLDWIYIDADHSYKSVKEDLEAWYPKVRRGGIISGHDYVEYSNGGIDFGVIQAVDEFCLKHGYDIEEWFDKGKFASWYFIKKYV